MSARCTCALAASRNALAKFSILYYPIPDLRLTTWFITVTIPPISHVTRVVTIYTSSLPFGSLNFAMSHASRPLFLPPLPTKIHLSTKLQTRFGEIDCECTTTLATETPTCELPFCAPFGWYQSQRCLELALGHFITLVV